MNLDHYRQHIDELLTKHLPNTPATLADAISYATLQGGKRFRPLLVYAAGLSFHAKETDLDYPAMAVEIIHAYSLVHDDLPAMDNDLLRRGQPTCHVKFGEAIAILAGDAMQALAFEILAKSTHPKLINMFQVLAKACGANGMAGGQAEDLLAAGKTIDEAHLQKIHRAKTGALIEASFMLGVLAAQDNITHTQCEQLENLGQQLGLAYQIQDDIFDVELSTEVRGKKQGADAALKKPTYPSILGLPNAKQKLQNTIEQIQTLLISMQQENSPLANLIHEVLTRKI